MSDNVKIRLATSNDTEKLLEIYAPYVAKTSISFEYEIPSVEEFSARIEKTLKKYPYIVTEINGEILGYSYTSEFNKRDAYNWAVEISIYIKENKRKTGLGRKLYEAIEKISKAQNIINLNACIACPNVEDRYLTRNSIEFHRHMGYKTVGKFHQCGYKFGRWYDVVWMEKIIRYHDSSPNPVILFPDLNKKVLRDIGIE